jgi:MFS family permease
MATLGLIGSLAVVIAFRLSMSPAAFAEWGWRGPFLVSAGLLGVSLWIRMKLDESPVFQKMKADGTVSKAPYAEAFGRWPNLKLVLIALFGVVCGGTTVWYTAQFYAMFFLQRVLKVDELQTSVLMAAALAVAAPSYLLFGWLSDRFGRKVFLLGGCAIMAAVAFPAYHLLTWAANPALARAQRDAPVVVYADPAACALQFDPIGGRTFDATGCDVAKSFLSKAGVSYRNAAAPAGARAEIRIGERVVPAPEPAGLSPAQRAAQTAAFRNESAGALRAVGYPQKADPQAVNAPLVIAIVAFFVFLAAMVYAPAAAFLVELFPARIRYTSLSLPYHLGSGWVGGLLPATAFAIVTANGNVYAGLWYTVAFCTLTTVVGLLTVPETRGRPIG